MRADRTTELVVHQRAAKDVPRLNQRCTATSDYRTAAAGPRLATVVIEGLLATDAAVPKSAINTEPQWFTNFTLESATLSATAP